MMNECNNNGFRVSDVLVRAQKKILSKMAGKNVSRVLIDDQTAQLLDNFYQLIKHYTRTKKEAEKIVKNIIKVTMKLGVLQRNKQFTDTELHVLREFLSKFQVLQMAIVSFYEVDFSYDRGYLMAAVNECRQLLRPIVANYLTVKSVNKFDLVFDFFLDATILDALFSPNSKTRDALGKLVSDLNHMLDSAAI